LKRAVPGFVRGYAAFFAFRKKCAGCGPSEAVPLLQGLMGKVAELVLSPLRGLTIFGGISQGCAAPCGALALG
jgi:hypothetical protein